MAHPEPHLKVRLDPELNAWVRRSAAENCRTLNGEIEYRLRLAREAEQSSRATGSPAAGEALRA